MPIGHWEGAMAGSDPVVIEENWETYSNKSEGRRHQVLYAVLTTNATGEVFRGAAMCASGEHRIRRGECRTKKRPGCCPIALFVAMRAADLSRVNAIVCETARHGCQWLDYIAGKNIGKNAQARRRGPTRRREIIGGFASANDLIPSVAKMQDQVVSKLITQNCA
jgi:hypothetical protein